MVQTNGVENPNEHLEIPKWISVQYFKKILDKEEPDYVKVLKFTPVAAIPPGENFTSLMIRIYIDLQMKDGSTKQKSYVLKTMLAEERGGKAIKEVGIFPKELKMYSTYLPAFEALYKAAGANIQLAPKCLYTEETEDGINFVFEDLAVKKFKNVNRLKGLDMEHMEYSLKKLAEYHAASAVYVEQNRPNPKEFSEGFVSLNCKEFVDDGFKLKESAYKQSMSNWGLKDAEKYINSFPTVKQNWDMAKSSLYVDPNEFNVLIHGDFWSSNLMYSYAPDGKIDQVLLLDFQIGKWGSPAQDLLFFITISAEKSIRLNKFDTFVEIYWERLIECLKLLNYTGRLPQLRDLHMSMYKKNNAFYAFFAIFNHLPITMLPTDKDSNLHSLLDSNEEGQKYRLRIFSNPAFAEIMKDLYPFYYKRGLFNFTDYEE